MRRIMLVQMLRSSTFALVSALTIASSVSIHNTSYNSPHVSAPMDETFSEKWRDLEALLSFRNAIKADPMHSLSNWTCNNSENVCSSWNGVLCRKGTTHTVVAIILPQLGLEGTISPSIGNLPFLEILNLSSNYLQGRIPSKLGQLKALKLLDLNSNLLKGSIPTSLSDCTHLQWIILSTNNLTGNIPARLGGLGSLRYLRLSYNDLTGTVPDSFVNCTFLQWITLASNNLYGGITPTLGNCTSLRKIKLSANFFTGGFDIGYSSSLKVLSAHTNNFSGALPASLANCTQLQLLDFRRNRLRGELPWYLANFQKLRVLSLGYNELHGRLPALMVNRLTNLQVLDLSNNMFDGRIPSNLENLKGFGVLGDPQVSGNTLYEDIPMVIKGKEYGLEYVLAANTILDLSSNNLSGWIPESIGNLSSLRLLNLSGNRLEGAIPASLGQIWTLEQLDLCRNKLSGRIPEELTLLSLLAYLDLSSNRLCGEIPRGTQLETFTAKAFNRNLCLCGGPLQSCSAKNKASSPLPLATTNFKSMWSVIDENVSMLALALGFGIAFLGTMSLIIWGDRVWFCIRAIKVQGFCGDVDSQLCSWSLGYSLRFTFHSFTSATIAPA